MKIQAKIHCCQCNSDYQVYLQSLQTVKSLLIQTNSLYLPIKQTNNNFTKRKKKVGKKMRLNSDCIRDILLTIELVSDGHKQFLIFPSDFDEVFDDGFELFNSYNEAELTYHVRQCDKAGLLSGVKFPADGGFVFCDLTPKGHWFLNTIRPKSVWKKLTSAGHATLPFLLDMASSLSIEVLKSIIPSIRL